MKKAYIQPEIELLKVSALNDFLVSSPENRLEGGTNDDWSNDENGNEYESDSEDSWA